MSLKRLSYVSSVLCPWRVQVWKRWFGDSFEVWTWFVHLALCGCIESCMSTRLQLLCLVRSFFRMTDDCCLEALLLVDAKSRERLRLAAVSMANYRYHVLQRQTHLEERGELSDDPISETSSLSGATKKLQSKHISRKSEFYCRARKHLIKKRRRSSASRSAQTVRDGFPVKMQRSRNSVHLRH